jgi:hypothetical protein
MVGFALLNSGKKEERQYENGMLNGSAVTFGVDGDKFEFTYVEGRIEGDESSSSFSFFMDRSRNRFRVG